MVDDSNYTRFAFLKFQFYGFTTQKGITILFKLDDILNEPSIGKNKMGEICNHKLKTPNRNVVDSKILSRDIPQAIVPQKYYKESLRLKTDLTLDSIR
jgi:hypothetical protein